MNIVVLYNTAWMEMMIHCWRQIEGLEINDIPLPVRDWEQNPELKKKIAGLIIDMAEVKKPAFILDVNSAGILPLDDKGSKWTVSECPVPWCEWWWDDPINNYGLWRSKNLLEEWQNALLSRNAVHFMWDATLAREYSEWLGIEITHLPHATHPGALNPDAVQFSQKKFTPTDFSFLGTLYDKPQPFEDPEKSRESDFVLQKRLLYPSETYFDIIRKNNSEIPLFTETFTQGKKSDTVFSEKVQSWRGKIGVMTGFERRNKILMQVADKFDSHFFLGRNMPENIRAQTENIYQPTELTALYRNSVISLDLNNGQGFTATTMRAYEIMSCGGILACNYTPDFDPYEKLAGSVYFRFSNPDELELIYRNLSNNSHLRETISNSARQYVIENHAWTNRLNTIIEKLKSHITL